MAWRTADGCIANGFEFDYRLIILFHEAVFHYLNVAFDCIIVFHVILYLKINKLKRLVFFQ